jgi:phenylacetate-CoA ligase
VLLTAEKVLPEQKEVIAQVFGARVIEEYGSSELGVMAFECPHGGLHTSDETYVLEVAEPGPDGSGELLATSLVNEALPLIRYRVGDVVSRSDDLCTCGRPLGLLAEIAGRTTDYFLDDAGRVVHPFSLMLSVQRLEPLQRYRIVQIAPGRVELQFQGDHDLDERDSAAVHTLIRDVLGERTQVTVTRFDALPLGPRGKHRFLASEVANGRPA